MSKVNLVDSLFDRRHPFESAILCSFDLNLNLFENYLSKLNALYTCTDIAIFVDAHTYDQFMGSGYVPRDLNKRYLVTRLKTAGVFHTKLYMLASTKKAVIGIGSANLTRDGITSNLELLSTFEISEQQQTFGPLLRDCISYVRQLAYLSKSERARDQVEAFSQLCHPFVQGRDKSELRLIHNLDAPLLNSILNYMNGRTISRVQIISPFFDNSLEPLKALRERLPNCRYEIYLQQKKSNFPVSHFDSQMATIKLYRDIDRYLHGKAILLQTENGSVLYMGSANFTKSALLKSAVQGNYELGVIGPVEEETIKSILYPAGHQAFEVVTASEVEINPRPEPQSALSHQVECLIEAVLKNSHILIAVNPEITVNQFQPQHYQLEDFYGNHYEGSIGSNLSVEFNATIRKAIQGRFAIQLIGVNGQGNEVISNLVWVIEWDEHTGNRQSRQLRRIYSDPSQLFAVLEEIAAAGDERELMLFLHSFDVPLDLSLPPRLAHNLRDMKSKGNVIGSLPIHRNEFFSDSVLAAYDACLNRLLGKMKQHRKQLQPDRIENFVLIYNAFLVLLDFVNSWADKRYRTRSIISGDDWLIIRNCYDMLLKYTAVAWELIWAKDGFRNNINARLVERNTIEEETYGTFEQYLLTEYAGSADQLSEFVLKPLQTFKVLEVELKIQTQQGRLVQPKVFPNRHLYIEPLALERLDQLVTTDALRLKTSGGADYLAK